MNPSLRKRLEAAWTDFLDANPDDVTSPAEFPGHALITFEQLLGILDAAAEPPANPYDVTSEGHLFLAWHRGFCEGVKHGTQQASETITQTVAAALGRDGNPWRTA